MHTTMPTSSVLVTGSDSGGACTIVIVTLPPYYSGAATHSHAHQSEACYVVHGTLAFTQNGYMSTLLAGASAQIAAGTPHAYWNPTAAPTTILLLYRPGLDAETALRFVAGAAV